jgi:hypothetical protein
MIWQTVPSGPIVTTLEDAMVSQYPTVNGWVCPKCQNHQGNLHCKAGVLICWVGANMSGCIHYKEERRLSHDRP